MPYNRVWLYKTRSERKTKIANSMPLCACDSRERKRPVKIPSTSIPVHNVAKARRSVTALLQKKEGKGAEECLRLF